MRRPKTLLLILGIPVLAIAYVFIMGTTGACQTCARIMASVMPSSSMEYPQQHAAAGAGEPVVREYPPGSIFNIPLRTLDGTNTTLASHAGRPIFIEVWATWCAPCVKARKAINEHASAFKDVATVVGVNVDTTGPATVRRYLEKNPSPAFVEYMTTPEFNDAIRPYERTRTIPKFVYVSPSGQVIDVVHGMPELEFALAMLRNLRVDPTGTNG